MQINFIELREDFCGLWQPLAYGGGELCPPQTLKIKKKI